MEGSWRERGAADSPRAGIWACVRIWTLVRLPFVYTLRARARSYLGSARWQWAWPSGASRGRPTPFLQAPLARFAAVLCFLRNLPTYRNQAPLAIAVHTWSTSPLHFPTFAAAAAARERPRLGWRNRRVEVTSPPAIPGRAAHGSTGSLFAPLPSRTR